MIVNLWMGFDDRAKREVESAEISDERKALSDPQVRSIYRKDNPVGPRSYELWSLYYEAANDRRVKDIHRKLLAKYPNKLRTVGAWWFDGRQVGTEFKFDRDGNATGTTGTPIFPLDARILEYMPDNVTFDKNGNETARTRPLVTSDVNMGMGQTERVF